ncbi:MAG: glycosyltransferase family 4 protein, partial [Kiritimatiellae bacterium]|nr:glycosyltransferase family 4 protein [Kiritimatiellia bacterium]MDW8459006.1 glycosyltransferase family 4 protein [Verrucomicrobiota bacterium]
MIAPYPASALLPLAELRPRYHTEHPAPWVRALATALARSGQVNVRVLVDSRAVTRRHEVRADEVTYVFVPKREPIRTDPLHGYIPGAIRIARELRADPPDLVIGFGVEGGCARLAIRQAYPSVVFIQGIIEKTSEFRDILPFRLRAYLRDERRALFDADALVAETTFARDWARGHNPRCMIALIPHAMDTAFLENRPTYREPIALCIGSLNRIKDPETVL